MPNLISPEKLQAVAKEMIDVMKKHELTNANCNVTAASLIGLLVHTSPEPLRNLQAETLSGMVGASLKTALGADEMQDKEQIKVSSDLLDSFLATWGEPVSIHACCVHLAFLCAKAPKEHRDEVAMEISRMLGKFLKSALTFGVPKNEH